LTVWGSLCLAYVRYHLWLVPQDAAWFIADRLLRLHRYRDRLRLEEQYQRYDRSRPDYRACTVFGGVQPVPGYIGLIGCLVLVFVLTSSSLWDGQVTFANVATAFGSVSLPSLMAVKLEY
jgi:hypothetical protein